MKKLFSLLMIVSILLGVSACATMRNTPPEFKGLRTVVEVELDAEYDPLEGITAVDTQDGNLTEMIEVQGFQEAWLKKVGIYTYKIYVEDKAGLSAEASITLKVGNPTVQLRGVQNGQSYYIGSKSFDPIRGVTAFDYTDPNNPVDLTDQITYTQDYNLERTGRYSITVSVENDKGEVASEVISLTVKTLTKDLPAELTEEPITITLWHSNGDSIDAAVKKYAAEFSKVYPNITVNVVKQGSNYNELKDLTVKAIQGGTLPNIVQGYPDHVMEYIDNRALISLTPYIDHPIHGFGDAEDEAFVDILPNYRLENSQYTADGEYYSMPFNKSTEVVIYNKQVFDELIANGVITEFPKTWQELFALAPELEKIKDKHIDRIVGVLNQSSNKLLHKTPDQIKDIKSKFVPFAYDSADNAFITLLRQWGGTYTSINAARGGVLDFNEDPATTRMLSFVYDNKDIFTIPEHWQTNYASDPFKVGQAFVTIGSTGGTRYNTPEPGTFDLGIAPMLYNEDLPEFNTAIQQGTNMSITNTGTDQQKLASWYFLEYITSKDVQLDFAMETGYQPVRNSVYSIPEYQNFFTGVDADGNALKGENLTKSLGARAAAIQKDTLFFDQAYVGSSKTRDAVAVAYERVVLSDSLDKDKVIRDAIAYAYDEARRVLGN